MFGRQHDSTPPSAQAEVDRRELADLRSRVAALEAAVAALQASPSATAVPGVPAAPVEPDFMAEVRDLKARGKLINAIKVYREATGVGLKQAKETVERLP
jgi:large subunit ribosomal protein L7/L12